MSIGKYLFSLEKRRNWWLRKIPDSPLRDYYAVPFPEMKAAWHQVDYLALDYETTGLDPKKDEILSIGYTTIRGTTLCFADSVYLLAKPSTDIPEASAVVHGILDDEASRAQSLEELLPQLLQDLSGKALLAHHAPIEYHFLNIACKRIYGYPFIGPVVDTLALEVRALRNRNHSIKVGDLRLATTRTRYNLPRYPAHNALTDAIAAGELFLAQIAHRTGKRSPMLKDLTVVI